MQTTARTSLLLATTCSLLAATATHARSARAGEDPEVARIMAQFADEPTVRQVQVAAVKYYNVSPARIRSLSHRARLKALVPGISVGFTTSLSHYNEQLDDIVFRKQGIADYDSQNADYNAVTATATWSLDRLVFNAEQLDVMALIGIQDGVQREVTALYFVRRRLQIELLLNPPKTLQARLSGMLRLQELTGLLDAYTGGFFSRWTKRRKHEDRKREARQTLLRAAAMAYTAGEPALRPARPWGRAEAERSTPLVSPIASAHRLLLQMRGAPSAAGARAGR